ncbi:MAG: hypothetical protein HAW61_03730 [Candidatus Portiera sp.]|nr:hypothetical protein [Portiera sp.]
MISANMFGAKRVQVTESNQSAPWYFLDDNYIIHRDGSVSALAQIDGYDIYMQDASSAANYLNNINNIINQLPLNISFEFHMHRRRDTISPQRYRAQKLCRSIKVLEELRESYISHIEESCYKNSIYLLIHQHREISLSTLMSAWNPDSLEKIYNDALQQKVQLAKYCDTLATKLNGFRMLNREDASKFLYEASHHRSCEIIPTDRYDLQNLLAPSGQLVDDVYVMNGINVKAGLLYFYPEPSPRLFTDLFSWLPVDMDIALYLRRKDSGSLLRKSGAEEVKQEKQIATSDAMAEKRLLEISEWRRYIVNNDLQIFANVCFIKLYGDPSTIRHYCNEINEQLSALGGIMESEKLLRFSLNYSLPGNMHKSKFMRHDHTEMVSCLLPAVEFHQGNGYEEAILGTNHTFSGFDLSNKSGGEFYHSMTVAKTGSGKGVLNCARIIQLYGLGYDFYTIEIGNTYEFLFKLLGGNYATLDPDESVINPFPPYSEATETISSVLVSPTIRSLAKIFTDGNMQLDIHQIAICEMTLKSVYKQPPQQSLKNGGDLNNNSNKNLAPNLQDFYNCLSKLSEKNLSDKQKRARDEILVNVKSFLDTIIGERFKHENNLTISDGLFGADFKRLKDDAHLMMTYLTFLSLRFGQKALFNQTPTFISIDELHEFARIDKETIRTLCTQIARMGRKESGYINLITQEAEDILKLDSSLISQMHITNLLYTESRHSLLLDTLSSLNTQAFDTWSNYTTGHKEYRPAMIGFGDKWVDSFLTYPMEILALADTSNRGLQIKREILERNTANAVKTNKTNNQTMEDSYKELLAHYQAA